MGDIVKIKFLRDGEPVFPVPTTINRNSTEEMLKEDITDALNEAQRRLEKHEQFRIVYTDEDGDNEVAIAVAVRRLVAFCLNTDLELYFAETEQKESGSHLISLRIDWKEVQRDNTTTTGIAGQQQTNPQGSNTATTSRMGAVLVEQMMTFCSRRFVDIENIEDSVPQFDTYKEKSCWITGMYKAVINTYTECRERGIRTTKAEIHKALINKIRATNHQYRAAALKRTRVETKNGRAVTRRVATDEFLRLGTTSAQAWLDTYGDILRKPGREERSSKRQKAVPHHWTRTIRYMRTKESDVRVLQDTQLPEALQEGAAVGDDRNGPPAGLREEGEASDDDGDSSSDEDDSSSDEDDSSSDEDDSSSDEDDGDSCSDDDDDRPKRRKKKKREDKRKKKVQKKTRPVPIYANADVSSDEDDILDDIEEYVEDPELPRLRGYGTFNNQCSILMEDGIEEQEVGTQREVGGQGNRGRGGGKGDRGRGSRGRGGGRGRQQQQHAGGRLRGGGIRKREMTATQEVEVGQGRSTRLRNQAELMSQPI